VGDKTDVWLGAITSERGNSRKGRFNKFTRAGRKQLGRKRAVQTDHTDCGAVSFSGRGGRDA
jgi:hypothetical protein